MDKILDFILIIICIIFNAIIFILSKANNIKITIITFIFTIAILVLFYLIVIAVGFLDKLISFVFNLKITIKTKILSNKKLFIKG